RPRFSLRRPTDAAGPADRDRVRVDAGRVDRPGVRPAVARRRGHDQSAPPGDLDRTSPPSGSVRYDESQDAFCRARRRATTTGGAGLTSSSRILVVDDDRAIRDMLRQALELEGHTVETAGDGAQALTAIERAPPALVLLDMRMPVLDGWGVVQELRARAIA